jgi:hypothetical protein
LPRKAQPVPPIYEPEVAADAIVWAAEHNRRDLYVGGSTTVAIVGNKIAPGLGDWYLGHTGYDSQMTDEPADPDRPDNLWRPIPGDHGAHGHFGQRSTNRSIQLWLTTHRALVATAGVSIGAAALLTLRRTEPKENGHVKHPFWQQVKQFVQSRT